MNGARMRSCSLAGTRPRKTSRSVPRLSAPWSARTLTSPACGVFAGSGRISACPGPTYHNAYACSARVLTITPWTRSIACLMWTRAAVCRYIVRQHEREIRPAMLDRLERPAVDVTVVAPPVSLARRQALFFAAVAITTMGLLWLLAAALSAGGFDAFDIALLVLFAVTLPWSVIGSWNAMIGFFIMRFAPNPIALVCPAAAPVKGDEPIVMPTAILVCIRNEMPERVIRNLKPMMSGLAAAGGREHFHVYVLSDTDDGPGAAAEEAAFAAFANAWAGDRKSV